MAVPPSLSLAAGPAPRNSQSTQLAVRSSATPFEPACATHMVSLKTARHLAQYDYPVMSMIHYTPGTSDHVSLTTALKRIQLTDLPSPLTLFPSRDEGDWQKPG